MARTGSCQRHTAWIADRPCSVAFCRYADPSHGTSPGQRVEYLGDQTYLHLLCVGQDLTLLADPATLLKEGDGVALNCCNSFLDQLEIVCLLEGKQLDGEATDDSRLT